MDWIDHLPFFRWNTSAQDIETPATFVLDPVDLVFSALVKLLLWISGFLWGFAESLARMTLAADLVRELGDTTNEIVTEVGNLILVRGTFALLLAFGVILVVFKVIFKPGEIGAVIKTVMISFLATACLIIYVTSTTHAHNEEQGINDGIAQARADCRQEKLAEFNNNQDPIASVFDSYGASESSFADICERENPRVSAYRTFSASGIIRNVSNISTSLGTGLTEAINLASDDTSPLPIPDVDEIENSPLDCEYYVAELHRRAKTLEEAERANSEQGWGFNTLGRYELAKAISDIWLVTTYPANAFAQYGQSPVAGKVYCRALEARSGISVWDQHEITVDTAAGQGEECNMELNPQRYTWKWSDEFDASCQPTPDPYRSEYEQSSDEGKFFLGSRAELILGDAIVGLPDRIKGIQEEIEADEFDNPIDDLLDGCLDGESALAARYVGKFSRWQGVLQFMRIQANQLIHPASPPEVGERCVYDESRSETDGSIVRENSDDKCTDPDGGTLPFFNTGKPWVINQLPPSPDPGPCHKLRAFLYLLHATPDWHKVGSSDSKYVKQLIRIPEADSKPDEWNLDEHYDDTNDLVELWHPAMAYLCGDQSGLEKAKKSVPEISEWSSSLKLCVFRLAYHMLGYDLAKTCLTADGRYQNDEDMLSCLALRTVWMLNAQPHSPLTKDGGPSLLHFFSGKADSDGFVAKTGPGVWNETDGIQDKPELIMSVFMAALYADYHVNIAMPSAVNYYAENLDKEEYPPYTGDPTACRYSSSSVIFSELCSTITSEHADIPSQHIAILETLFGDTQFISGVLSRADTLLNSSIGLIPNPEASGKANLNRLITAQFVVDNDSYRLSNALCPSTSGDGESGCDENEHPDFSPSPTYQQYRQGANYDHGVRLANFWALCAPTAFTEAASDLAPWNETGTDITTKYWKVRDEFSNIKRIQATGADGSNINIEDTANNQTSLGAAFNHPQGNNCAYVWANAVADTRALDVTTQSCTFGGGIVGKIPGNREACTALNELLNSLGTGPRRLVEGDITQGLTAGSSGDFELHLEQLSPYEERNEHAETWIAEANDRDGPGLRALTAAGVGLITSIAILVLMIVLLALAVLTQLLLIITLSLLPVMLLVAIYPNLELQSKIFKGFFTVLIFVILSKVLALLFLSALSLLIWIVTIIGFELVGDFAGGYGVMILVLMIVFIIFKISGKALKKGKEIAKRGGVMAWNTATAPARLAKRTYERAGKITRGFTRPAGALGYATGKASARRQTKQLPQGSDKTPQKTSSAPKQPEAAKKAKPATAKKPGT